MIMEFTCNICGHEFPFEVDLSPPKGLSTDMIHAISANDCPRCDARRVCDEEYYDEQ